ncbi:hypothetical protein TrispH2_008415 [Trichoplax sp. H2]|nr:hypothetical protein TrispH2_008415 [Trichoplax sp. H2]|eukprot:RDD40640.1 hypothetical protein TrispH2_008415 [Trichoplax sp. H2]
MKALKIKFRGPIVQISFVVANVENYLNRNRQVIGCFTKKKDQPVHADYLQHASILSLANSSCANNYILGILLSLSYEQNDNAGESADTFEVVSDLFEISINTIAEQI